MCRYTRFSRTKNEVLREKVRVASIEDKMSETRLRWFGHVKKRSENAPVRMCEAISLSGCKRSMKQSKKSCNEVIRNYLSL